MKRNRSIILIVLLLVTIKYYGQSGLSMSVYGKAIDWNSNMPIKDFEVTLFRIEDGVTKDISSAKTNEEGFYKIRYLVKGNYEFLIELPGIGIIQVLDFEGGIYDNFNGFEVREGQNLNLNFTIGSAEFGDIKKEYIAPDIINITILYPEDLLYEPVPEERTAMQSTSTCRVIKGKAPEVPVGDDVDLGDEVDPKTGKVKRATGGRFTPFLRYSNLSIDCKDNKCVLERIDVTISATIELHSENWFYTRCGTGCKETIGSCLKECMRKHENKHWDETNEYIKSSLCDYIKALNNRLAKCNCYLNDKWHYLFKCPEDLKNIMNQYLNEYYDYMSETGETNAYMVSDPCWDACKKEHCNGDQQ